VSPLRPTDPRSPVVVKDAGTPSPNYFGLTVDPAKDYTSSGAGPHARSNWSPPTSNVRSTAAASPRMVPLDQNPDLEAFRRQTEINGFTRAGFTGLKMAPPTPSRAGSKSFFSGSNASASPLTSIPRPRSPKPKTTASESKLPEPKQRSPKRMLSSPSPEFTDRPRRNSPAEFNDRDNELAPQAVQFLSEERDLRLSLPATSKSPSPPALHQRAETLPAVLDGELPGESKDGPTLVTPQHVVNLLDASSESILLLDLRVSTQYARSRITGALNLCVPTTLLKRPSYNLQKLAETFSHDEETKRMFERWRSCKYIIVYDSSSTLLKDAFSCMHMLKKFVREGWRGFQYVIRGGFADFSKRFPHLISHDSAPGTTTGSRTMTIDASIAPVVGGCPMPANTMKTAANPFFGNIRQNMDLIGGVGQMPIKQPSSMTQQQKDDLPTWLRLAADPNDDGKLVSDKFLQIEKREQKRMQEALSGRVHYGTPRADAVKNFQIAGIEKGAKNRYNNIWPYEHSRVKLEGVMDGGCDYVNANHLKATWSSKRYIATQGPIPATFNVRIRPRASLRIQANISCRISGTLCGSKMSELSSC
jgi:tyrosine-protein phosphatase 2/3